MPDSDISRILIVEDERKVAEKFQRALEKIGESRIAESSDQVFDQLEEFKPQVILLDIVLEAEESPSLWWDAGVRILEVIRRSEPPICDIPVIVVTGHIGQDVEERCRELGVKEFFRKPVSIQDLRNAVRDALADRPA